MHPKHAMDKPIFGRFQVSKELSALGELSIKGKDSSLTLSSDTELVLQPHVGTLLGESVAGQKISCVGCILVGQRNSFRSDRALHYATIFPHYVVIGEKHIDPERADIVSVSFSTEETGLMVGDRAAFGSVFPDAAALKSMLGDSNTEVFDGAQVAYFNGKMTIAEVSTALGVVRIVNQPRSSFGGADGVRIDNHVQFVIAPSQGITLEEAERRVHVLLRFLSVVAGRTQTASQFSIKTGDENASSDEAVVQLNMAPKRQDAHEVRRWDLPIDPITRPDEFSRVMKTWIERDSDRLAPRVRHAEGTSKGNSYGVDRLVAAANLFDLLPSEDVPTSVALPDDLLEVAAAAKKAFKDLPPSAERESVLGAISRLGSPTMNARVQHRSEIVLDELRPYFPDLSKVLRLAVKCRNYFVHGPSKGFDYSVVQPFLPFLTDALEFTFVVSDLIESGWDVQRWKHAHHSMGHPFVTFRESYKDQRQRLISAGLIKPDPPVPSVPIAGATTD